MADNREGLVDGARSVPTVKEPTISYGDADGMWFNLKIDSGGARRRPRAFGARYAKSLDK